MSFGNINIIFAKFRTMASGNPVTLQHSSL